MILVKKWLFLLKYSKYQKGWLIIFPQKYQNNARTIVRWCDGWSLLWPLTCPKNKETCLETRLWNHKLESFEMLTD